MIGCKRLSLGDEYYAAFNRPDVELVPLGDDGIGRILPGGLTAGGREYSFDDLVLATGFDAMTGALARIDIRGRGGLALAEGWRRGRACISADVEGFPNLFVVTGPAARRCCRT